MKNGAATGRIVESVGDRAGIVGENAGGCGGGVEKLSRPAERLGARSAVVGEGGGARGRSVRKRRLAARRATGGSASIDDDGTGGRGGNGEAEDRRVPCAGNGVAIDGEVGAGGSPAIDDDLTVPPLRLTLSLPAGEEPNISTWPPSAPLAVAPFSTRTALPKVADAFIEMAPPWEAMALPPSKVMCAFPAVELSVNPMIPLLLTSKVAVPPVAAL
jgi:hypothetical protein